MLRDFIYGGNKPVKASYKANAKMKTGMAVVIDDTDMTAKFPSAITGSELYFADKERQPTGYNTSRANMSDYDSNFIEIEVGEFLKLKKYAVGDEFGTDAKGTGVTVGKVVVAGVDGKLVNATLTATSRYLYVEDVVDNGHTLMKIRVLDTPIANS